MAKLILSLEGSVIREVPLDKERIMIGRKPSNEIQIENLAVSGEHACIVTILNDSFLEDMGSTNGTLVNGNPIKKHILQNNDVIEIGKYKLKYIAGAPAAAAELGVTVGAISQQLRKAEAEVGLRLVERKGKSIALTTRGRHYHDDVKAAFDALREAQSERQSPLPPTPSTRWLQISRTSRPHVPVPGREQRPPQKRYQYSFRRLPWL